MKFLSFRWEMAAEAEMLRIARRSKGRSFMGQLFDVFILDYKK
jgi:hypothetical protein